MRDTPTLLKTLGILLLLSCIFCVPNVGVVDDFLARSARSQLVEGFEKRMTAEELTRLFEIPAKETDRSGFMREKLITAVPAARTFTFWFLESLLLGIGSITLGVLESRARKPKPVPQNTLEADNRVGPVDPTGA